MEEIKSFEELDINYEYNSNRNFVYADFFNKILPHCNSYRRFGGIFSGQKFVQCAEGLQDFIKENDGKMQLAIIPVFDEKDKEAISESSRDKVITEKWKLELSEIKDTLKQNHVKALAWMIATDRLIIKLILPQDKDGNPLTKEQLNNEDFLNEVGIFTNKHGEALSFHGQIDTKKNESDVIRITTSRPWIQKEKKQRDKDFEKFENFWNNEICKIGAITCKIKPLTDELLEYFKQTAPESAPISLKKLPSLYEFQNDAIEKWHDNGNIGIFEMATGTGKTFTAIGCIKKLQNLNKKLLVVIAAPYTNLVDQWEDVLKKWFLPSIKLEAGWTGDLRREIRAINRTNEDQLTIFVCSHAKFASNEFLKNIEKCKIPTMLIVDEAHHVGAGNSIVDDDGIHATEGARKGLSEKYDFRLALSATIERNFDPEGTNYLRTYFTGTRNESTVATFDLRRAINECSNCRKIKDKCNCGDFKGYLCGYNYYPHFIELTADEFDKYKAYTYRAMPYINSKDPVKKSIGQNIIIQRSEVIRDAEQKMPMFIDIMKSFSKIKHLLVFCSHNQYKDIENILNNSSETLGYSRPVFTTITYNKPKDKRKRKKILRDFANEDFDMILSNRVLDEGMDVPQAKSCIVLASTGNPAQFIQRRGRVLRQFDDTYLDGSRKTHADIYDILVKPNLEGLDDPETHKLEIGMIRSQLKRITEMAELAINRPKCIEKIKEFKQNLPEDVFEEYNPSEP